MAGFELIQTTLFSNQYLTSYWRMEGNSNDSKGTNNGSDTTITYSTANGKFGQGAGFNGSSSLVSVSDASNLKPTGNFTVGAWFKTTDTAEQSIFQTYSQNGAAVNGILLEFEGTDTLRLVSGKATGVVENTDYKNCRGLLDVNDGNWHSTIGIWDGSSLKLYVDGALDNSVSWSNAPAYNATNYVRIGCRNNTGSNANFFNGTIDDIFLLNGYAMTATDVLNFYRGSLLYGGSFLVGLM